MAAFEEVDSTVRDLDSKTPVALGTCDTGWGACPRNPPMW